MRPYKGILFKLDINRGAEPVEPLDCAKLIG